MRLAAALVLLVLASARPVLADAPAPKPARGPLEYREQWLPALPVLQLAPASADPLPHGATQVRVDFDWGSDFNLAAPVALRQERRYLIDGEHRTLTVELRRGFGRNTSVGARLPWRWQGGGVLDGIIDWWHGLLGFPTAGRELRPPNELRFEGFADPELQVPLRWEGRGGGSLGALELDLRRVFRGGSWRGALLTRVALPTGTGAFADSPAALAGQVLGAHTLGRHFDLHLGAGAVMLVRDRVAGLDYARTRGHSFVAVEWKPARRVSVLAQGELASRLLKNVSELPGLHGYLRLGAKVGLGRYTLDGGFVEGLKDQDSTTDFGIFLGLQRAF